MVRDFETYDKWAEFHKELQYEDFWRKKVAAEQHARELDSQTLINKALKMTFQFDKSKLLQYGHCHKFNKPVSFIPDTCQLETQECFVHRNSAKFTSSPAHTP